MPSCSSLLRGDPETIRPPGLPRFHTLSDGDQTMEKFTVSRNDEIYEAFAGITRAAGGTPVCTCRESMCRSRRPFSRSVVRRSGDPGG